MPSTVELPPHLCRKTRDEHTRDKFHKVTGKLADSSFKVEYHSITVVACRRALWKNTPSDLLGQKNTFEKFGFWVAKLDVLKMN